MENNTTVVINELEKAIKNYSFWGKLYFIENDYFNGIGIIISVLIPFGFAAILYLPNNNIDLVNFWFMIISGIGVVLSLLRILFNFSQRARFLLKQKIDTEEIYLLLKTDLIKVEEAIIQFNNIRRKDYNDIESS